MHGLGIYTYSRSSQGIIIEGKWNNGIRDGKFTVRQFPGIVGFAKDNIIIIPGYQTDIPLIPPPPYFEIDLI